MPDNNKLKELQAIFPESDIEWVIIQSGGFKSNNADVWVLVAPYVRNKTIQDRLDVVMGPENWRNEFVKWGESGVLCGLSLRVNNEWITKYDGSSETEIEAVKGGFTSSMKRAAMQWGIGRYLADFGSKIVSVNKSNKGKYRSKLKDENWYYWDPPVLYSKPPFKPDTSKEKYLDRINELTMKLSELENGNEVYDPLFKSFEVSALEDMDVPTLEDFGKRLALLTQYALDIAPLLDQLETKDGAKIRKEWKLSGWYDFDYKSDINELKSRMHNILEAVKMKLQEGQK